MSERDGIQDSKSDMTTLGYFKDVQKSLDTYESHVPIGVYVYYILYWRKNPAN